MWKWIHKPSKVPCGMSWRCNKCIPTCYQHWPYRIISVPYQTTSPCQGRQIWLWLGQVVWSFMNGCVKVFHKQIWAKDFPILGRVYFGNLFVLCNICTSHICTHVHICWKMPHHWRIIRQMFWLDDNKLKSGLVSQCKWMCFTWLMSPSVSMDVD